VSWGVGTIVAMAELFAEGRAAERGSLFETDEALEVTGPWVPIPSRSWRGRAVALLSHWDLG